MTNLTHDRYTDEADLAEACRTNRVKACTCRRCGSSFYGTGRLRTCAECVRVLTKVTARRIDLLRGGCNV